jgi:hypothetical protein
MDGPGVGNVGGVGVGDSKMQDPVLALFVFVAFIGPMTFVSTILHTTTTAMATINLVLALKGLPFINMLAKTTAWAAAKELFSRLLATSTHDVPHRVHRHTGRRSITDGLWVLSKTVLLPPGRDSRHLCLIMSGTARPPPSYQ